MKPRELWRPIERDKQGEGSRVWLYMVQYDNGNSNNKVSLKTPLTMGWGAGSSALHVLGLEEPVDSSGLTPKEYFPTGKRTWRMEQNSETVTSLFCCQNTVAQVESVSSRTHFLSSGGLIDLGVGCSMITKKPRDRY